MAKKMMRPAITTVLSLTALFCASGQDVKLPGSLNAVIEAHCLDCHDDSVAKGGLDLGSLKWNLSDPHTVGLWVKVYDQLASGKMPPKKRSRLKDAERQAVVEDLARAITLAQETKAQKQGRSVSRRVNRFEYENILRDLLHDPTLKVADQLPPDGEVHGFAKVGSALDVSHVQVDAYLDVVEVALRRALEFPAEKPSSKTRRFYAREQGRMWSGGGNGGWARFSLALEGLDINDEYSFKKRGFDPGKKVQSAGGGITVDDTAAKRTGPWRKSTRRSNHVGAHYLADDNKSTGAYGITWKATLPKPGTYEVRISFGGGEGLAKTAPYRVRHAGGETRLTIDQSQTPTIEGLWFPLGRFTFGSDASKPEPVAAEVSLSNKDAKGWVIADAVQFVHVDDLEKKIEKPEPQEEASTAIFRGAYTPFYYGFDKFKAPVRGDYKVRLKARAVLRQTDYVDWEGDKKPRHYPNLVLDASRRYPTPVNDRVFPGKRSEPVKVYSSTLDEPNTQSMLPIGVFEAPPEAPEVFELEAFLEEGAMVKLDCMRLPSPMVPAMPHTIQKIDPGRLSRSRLPLAGSRRADHQGMAAGILPCAVWRPSLQTDGSPCEAVRNASVAGGRKAFVGFHGTGLPAAGCRRRSSIDSTGMRSNC